MKRGGWGRNEQKVMEIALVVPSTSVGIVTNAGGRGKSNVVYRGCLYHYREKTSVKEKQKEREIERLVEGCGNGTEQGSAD